MGISIGGVGNTLEKCRKKLAGEKTSTQIWNEKNKERISEKRRGDPKFAEYRRKYYQEHKEELLAKRRKYFSEYYQKNREKIIEKQKARKKEGMK